MTNVWPNGSLSMPRVSSEFNPARRNPVTGIVQPHNGIDLVGFDAIHSPVTGTVTFAGYNGAAGIEVRIREDGTNDTIRLLHNRAVNVRVGQRVVQGQTVAWMGSTGQSTGPHCHEETRPGGGAAINPRDWYARRNAAAPAGGGARPVQEDDMFSDADRALLARVAETQGTVLRDADRGSVYFNDQFGIDHVLDYQSPDISFPEFMGALDKVFGPTQGVSAREFDIANAIALRRWNAKRAEIVNDVVARLIPVIEKGQGVALDPELVRSAIKEGLEGAAVEADVDDATVEKIANRVLDRQHERLAE